MRRNIDIFTQTHAPHSSRFVAGFDSINSGSCAVGFIAGQYRHIPALVTETVTDDDQWRVVNLKGGKGNEAHFDAIAVLGAVDDQQAADMALMQFGRMFDSIAMDVLQTNTNGLMRHLDTSHYHTKPGTIAPWQLKAMQDVICAEKPMWDDINLLSHKGQTANLMLDMQRHDDHDGLLSQFDGLPNLLEQLGVEEPGFDALIVQYQYLEKLTAQLHTAMKNAGKAGVQVVNVTVSKPFKRNKVAQVAVTYDMADGQSVTILFHNPDSTPSKLAPADTLISWKIQMNSRDITGAIQPNQGEGIALPVLAGRILKLVNQNSDRFKRYQVKKTEQAQSLADAEQRITDKTAIDKALDEEMTDLQQKIDAAHEQAKQQQELAQNGEALNAAPEPDINNLATQTTALIDALANPLAEQFISTNIRISKALVTGDDAGHFIENGQTVFKEFRIRIIDEGNGSYAFIQYQDAKKNWHQLKGNAVELPEFQEINDASLALWKTVNPQKNDDSNSDNSGTEDDNSATNPDQEFLQKIIAGTVDATTVDMDHIIELAEKYQADEAMNALVGQALETINQAEQEAAKSVG